MFDGKMFFGVTGMPILKIAFVKSAFALAEPVPLTLANLTTKSFIFISLIYVFSRFDGYRFLDFIFDNPQKFQRLNNFQWSEFLPERLAFHVVIRHQINQIFIARNDVIGFAFHRQIYVNFIIYVTRKRENLRDFSDNYS